MLFEGFPCCGRWVCCVDFGNVEEIDAELVRFVIFRRWIIISAACFGVQRSESLLLLKGLVLESEVIGTGVMDPNICVEFTACAFHLEFPEETRSEA